MNEQLPVELLNDAFNVFRDASKKLEEQYALLEDRVDELSAELAEKNRAIERSRRLAAMGEMAARIAHEIRNPLGSMSIFATILERELVAEPEKENGGAQRAASILSGHSACRCLRPRSRAFAKQAPVQDGGLLPDAMAAVADRTDGRRVSGLK